MSLDLGFFFQKLVFHEYLMNCGNILVAIFLQRHTFGLMCYFFVWCLVKVDIDVGIFVLKHNVWDCLASDGFQGTMSHEQLVVFSAPPPCSPIMSKATFQQADPCPVISSSTSSTTMMANICTRGTAPGLPLSSHHRVTSSQGAQRREQFQCAKLSPDDPPVEAQHSCSETSER